MAGTQDGQDARDTQDGPRPQDTEAAPAAGDGQAGRRELGRQARDVLALERRGFAGPGAKERAIREELGLSPVRYYQLLNALLDDTRALAHDPVTVNRLRRVRDARRAER
ncbi:DUF3263 domain-containing protein [Streptomyces tropicalis]|uniref:DUF3263 domain-containing protein n=1 Tax=Streptomyces tropicalis TaxID=3034234 RepID=UPI003F689B18